MASSGVTQPLLSGKNKGNVASAPKHGQHRGRKQRQPAVKARQPAVSRGLATLLILLCILSLYFAVFSATWLLWFAAPLPDRLRAEFGSEEGGDVVLASFSPACPQGNPSCPVLGGGFFFGLSTAPAHVEDLLEDTWLDFAKYGRAIDEGAAKEDKQCTGVGGEKACPASATPSPVHAWRNEAFPEERLRFWTEPEVEVGLAAGTGIDAFRLGIDWGRLVPHEPSGEGLEFDPAAVEGYKRILRLLKGKHNLKVMVTLFHHSFPKWGVPWGGWTNKKAVAYFTRFAEIAVREFGPWVDYWVTFNEPTIFCLLTYCLGAWPPGFTPNPISLALCFSPLGDYSQAMAHISEAHVAAYKLIHKQTHAPIGVAHNTAFMVPYSALDLAAQFYADYMNLYPWIDAIASHLDFCGLNYYSQETVSLNGLVAVPGEEYSEAGRQVNPEGFYHILMGFYNRYKDSHPGLRYVITENGMADVTDVLRGPYIVEHLLAVHAARLMGAPVDGYFHWTTSDNWEWADGYCPKFGLVKVDRANNLSRIPHPSYYLFKEIVESRVITGQVRQRQWGVLQEAVKAKGKHRFCRITDSAGRMSYGALDVPRDMEFSARDWRFGHFQQPSLETMFARIGDLLQAWATDIAGLLS